MRIVVVGSGASGVHFALTALEGGHSVTMLDVGHQRSPVPAPEATFDGLKDILPDPAAYFLGQRGEGVVYPATRPSYYGHPPSKHYVFDVPEQFQAVASAMEPLFTFARGGFAEAWTAGSYEFAEEDLQGFPFDRSALAPHYDLVARRIGIGAAHDDLARFIPHEASYLPPVVADPHSVWLLERYATRRDRLHREVGFYLGRSRVATLSTPYAGRSACAQCGRCLWGCPWEAIYRPSVTLQECERFPAFRYIPSALVSHFEYDGDGRITALAVEPLAEGVPERVEGETFVLAAGALASSKVVLDSIWRRTGKAERLTGLMDNRQIHVPFLTPAMLGRVVPTASYQFHHLAFGLEASDPAEYVHGQITTLKAAAVHPIVQSLPLDLRGALQLFRALRPALGIANVNLHDTRRAESWLTVQASQQADRTRLLIHYADPPDEAARMAHAVRRTRRALWRLGCVVPPGMTRRLPKGASVHYSGTLPMSRTPGRLTCDPDGRSHDFPNLLVADGATFPSLPAKNLTFTLMANASRMAARLG